MVTCIKKLIFCSFVNEVNLDFCIAKQQKMKNITPLLILFLFIACYDLNSQTAAHTNTPTTIIKSVESKEGNEYELIITLPESYNNEKIYKVLYYLDGWWLSDLVKGNYSLNFLTKETEALILVGISIKGDENDWNRQRNRDYTPSFYNKEKMRIDMKSGIIPLNEKTTGGGKEFAAFLKSVVFHDIENSYKTDKSNRGILGHSLGGLFGYYCLISHPELFNNYILISPSVWWNKSELLTDQKIDEIDDKASIYVVMGKNESNMLKQAIRKMTASLMLIEGDRNIVEFKTYEDMDHHAIVPIGIYKGLEYLYGKEQ